jgi:glycosyltransferase involved in cell wall biosynthesis
MPCVASKVYPYSEPIEGKDTIVHMKTGLFARSKREWVKYLQLLIDNENLRRKIGENAYEYVTKNWTWDKEKINKIYEDIQKLPTKSINDYIK